jgi:DNA adenine methylase
MLASFMKELISKNGLEGSHYSEAYAGGAAVAWALLFSGYASHVHVNDIDPAIHAFWSTVLDEPDTLCSLISRTRVSMAAWNRQRAVITNPQNYSPLALGFAAFFLNRTNRSGIIRGGVIGGQEQNGTWRLDARYSKPDLIDRIQKIARYRAQISLYRIDALSFLTKVVPKLPEKMLLYLDPPYYVKGGGLYEHNYDHKAHSAVARLVTTKLTRPWVVSYDAAPEVLDLYRGCSKRTYTLAYSVQGRYRGKEVIFFAPDLRVPMVVKPSKSAS